jgi:hypothetical protein
MPAFSMQKQASRNLVLSPNAQIAYGGILAENKLTIRQRFDPSSVFEKTPSRRTDYLAVGKGSEWATSDNITAWDIKATLKAEADAQFLGWIMAFVFGQEVVTGVAAPYTHAFTVPNISATMPCTTAYIEETQDEKFKIPDLAVGNFSLDVPERGSVMVTADAVGTGRWVEGAMVAALPALVAANYLLGSDVVINITPSGGAATSFSGRQKSLSIKLDRQAAPFKSSGDGLTSGSVASGQGKIALSFTIAAQAVDDINGWFEDQTLLAISIATNPALTYQFGFTFPAVHVKASKLTNMEDKVLWSVEFDETSCFQVGNTPAISGFVINDTPAYLVPA